MQQLHLLRALVLQMGKDEKLAEESLVSQQPGHQAAGAPQDTGTSLTMVTGEMVTAGLFRVVGSPVLTERVHDESRLGHW